MKKNNEKRVWKKRSGKSRCTAHTHSHTYKPTSIIHTVYKHMKYLRVQLTQHTQSHSHGKQKHNIFHLKVLYISSGKQKKKGQAERAQTLFEAYTHTHTPMMVLAKEILQSKKKKTHEK